MRFFMSFLQFPSLPLRGRCPEGAEGVTASPQGAYASDRLTATAALFTPASPFPKKSFASQNLFLGALLGSCRRRRMRESPRRSGVTASPSPPSLREVPRRGGRSCRVAARRVMRGMSTVIPRRLRLLFSRGRTRARSGNGANNAPLPSSQVVNATPWRCKESTCSPFSQKIFCFAKSFFGSPI